MTAVLEWLLDLEDVRLGRDAPLLLKWNPSIEAWMLFSVGLALVFWVVYQYRREQTTSGRRILLAVMRCLLFAVVVGVLCAPSLVLQRNRVEGSRVALLLDTSLSMNEKDTYEDEGLMASLMRGAGLSSEDELESLSRLDLARALLVRNDGAALRELSGKHGIEVLAFDDNVTSVGLATETLELDSLIPSLKRLEARGVATDVPSAIKRVLAGAHGRRLAAIVMLTDGQSTQSTALEDALSLAADRKIPIYPVRLGAPQARFDVEVSSLHAQESVFVRDIAAIEARITGHGLVEATEISARLIDEENGTVEARESVTLTPEAESVRAEFRFRPRRTGRVSYRVEVLPLDGERIVTNNADRIDVQVMDDLVRVLYVDGYPRYEYRYLKNALVREPTIQVSVLLLEADQQFVQEGTDPIRRFPETPDELRRYDVVLFGDVDPRGEWLSTAQAYMLVDFVGHEGGGFGLIAGERWSPRRFLDSALEKLIPVRIDPTFLGRYQEPLVRGFAAKLTEPGRRSRVFRFVEDRPTNERIFENLPELYWLARTLGPKPGATVLAEHPTMPSAFGSIPLMVTGRYGAGKLFFQATDDTWRWRRQTGEALHDAYWVQVVRELMPVRRVAGGRRYVIRTDRKSYPYGAPVRIQIEIMDPELLAERRDEIEVSISGEPLPIGPNSSGADEASSDSIEGSETRDTSAFQEHPSVRARVQLQCVAEQAPLFESIYIPDGPGRYRVEAKGIAARPEETTPSTGFRVARPNLELRHREANHKVLERMAAQTAGAVLDPDGLGQGFASIPDRSVRIPDDVTETLWDSKLVFVLFALLISMEWTLRKLFGLM